MPVTREQIVAVALDLLDEAGLDGPYPLLRTAARELSSPDQRFEHGLGVSSTACGPAT
jgi:hypothetical protein